MKIARLKVNEEYYYAEKKNNKFYLIEGDVFGDYKVTEKIIEGKLSYPVEPSKIVALGANYPKHITELNRSVLMQKVVETKTEPLIFLKPSSSLIASGENIILPKCSVNTHYEGELAIVIGKECRKVSKENAKDYIFGFTVANDVSERTIQNIDVQWTRAKGFDTFCPLGDVIETDVDGQNLSVKTILNGVVVQDGNTSEMINKIDETIEFISNVMTLKAGDVILTGTPMGVGQLNDGDICEVVIEKIGSLKNSVTLEK